MICNKCGEKDPRVVSSVCELRAMPGKGIVCAVTRTANEEDLKKH